MHAFLDYPVALSLMVAPFVLQLGSSNPLALWLAVATGAAAFILTFFTDHILGVIRILPYSLHLAVDLTVGVVFLLAPSVLGFFRHRCLVLLGQWCCGAVRGRTAQA